MWSVRFDSKLSTIVHPKYPSSSVWETVITMLFLVGLGLADETDVTVKGLEVIKKASRVYLEAYTSILLVEKEKLVRSGQSCPMLLQKC